VFTHGFCFCDRILRDHATIIFNLHIQTVVWKHAISEIQDSGEAMGGEPMFRIVHNVRLKHHGLCFARDPSAIDEVLHGVADFGDMNVSGDRSAGGQNESRRGFGKLPEERLEGI
jgi:hypothetical protein